MRSILKKKKINPKTVLGGLTYHPHQCTHYIISLKTMEHIVAIKVTHDFQPLVDLLPTSLSLNFDQKLKPYLDGVCLEVFSSC